MAAPIHSSRAYLAVLRLCLLGVFSASPVQAQHGSPHVLSGITAADEALVEQSRAAGNSLATTLSPDGLLNRGQGVANAEARALLDQLRGTNQTMRDMGALERDKRVMQGYSTLVFASQSLGSQGLNEILKAVAGQPDTVVVLRGVPRGMKLGEGVLAVQQLAAAITPMPNVIINPTLFREHKVAAVPTIVVMSDQGAGKGLEPVGRVSGISDPAWLKRRLQGHGTRDLGNAGPVAEISEPDLIEVAKQKVMEIDWDEKKRQAQARFWAKQTFFQLPAAPRTTIREIDPTIVLTENIMAGDKVIALKGTRINPLEVRDFTQALVVFDPLDRRQVEAVRKALPGIASAKGVRRVMLIATRFDAELGWDSYKQVTSNFNAPVFLLTPDIASRFDLAHVPSIVTAKDKKFVVREIGMGLN